MTLNTRYDNNIQIHTCHVHSHIHKHPPPRSQHNPPPFSRHILLDRAMGFKDILDWLRANNMGDLAIKVAEMGIDDMDSLRATDITTFQENGLDNLSTRRIWESLHGPDILVIHESEPATTRLISPLYKPEAEVA